MTPKVNFYKEKLQAETEKCSKRGERQGQIPKEEHRDCRKPAQNE